MTCWNDLPDEIFELILSSCISEKVRSVNKKWKKVIDNYNCKKGVAFELTVKLCESYISGNPQYCRSVVYIWWHCKREVRYIKYYKSEYNGLYRVCDNIYHEYMPCNCVNRRYYKKSLMDQVIKDFCPLDILIYWLNKHYLSNNEKFVERSLKYIIAQHLGGISEEKNKLKFLGLCEYITKLKLFDSSIM
jgi:hypothetical protein